MTEPLADEAVTRITCELTEAPKRTDVPVFDKQKDAEASKGTYHYKLWLPAGYSADPQKSWPCLFIMSPAGNASMGPFKNHLTANGYVVVMLEEAKNGPWEPIVGNFLAAHDDVVQRVRVAADRKYATGFSGGARGSSVFAQLRPGFCGLILQGAGGAADDEGQYHVKGLKNNAKLRIAMIIGKTDKNFREVEKLEKLFSRDQFAVFPWDGGHNAAPAGLFEKAMAWINEKG
jgi:predicted peptidase